MNLKAVLAKAPRNFERAKKNPPEIEDGIKHEGAITINASAEKIYAYWRNVKNLPSFMAHLESIEEKSPLLSKWKWKALRDQITVEWESEITEEIPNALITWRSREGSTVAHAGEVFFDELAHGRGTEVRVTLTYRPPGGRITDFLEKVLGESPSLSIAEDLRRLRELMEVGVIPTTEGQPRGGMEETKNPALHRS